MFFFIGKPYMGPHADIYIYMQPPPPRDRPFSLISLAHDILSSKASLTESTTLHMTQEGYELT